MDEALKVSDRKVYNINLITTVLELLLEIKNRRLWNNIISFCSSFCSDKINNSDQELDGILKVQTRYLTDKPNPFI